MATLIKDLCEGKPSIALQSMVDGLRNLRGMNVDMGTFGTKYNGICFGCAATATIQNLLKVEFVSLAESTFYEWVALQDNEYLPGDIFDFENAMEWARKGVMKKIFEYLGVSEYLNHDYSYRFRLETCNYLGQLTDVEDLIQQLKEKGL